MFITLKNKIHIALLKAVNHLRDNRVRGDDVLDLLGPGVHETEPATSQSDEGAIFNLKLVTVSVDFISHLQHWNEDKEQQKRWIII